MSKEEFMGSSSKRKTNDRVRINPPKSISVSVTPTGGGLSSSPIDTNTICPVSFHIKLVRQDTPAGLLIEIDGNSLLLNSGVEVGKISDKILKQIELCYGIGVHYSVVSVIDKKGVRYAEFSQS